MLGRLGLLIAAIAATGIGIGIPAPAQAAPCNYVIGQQCQPQPWNGPLMPTWDIPGYYGGWTTVPVICDPINYTCRGYVPAR